MRAWLPLMAILGLAACDPQIPDSGAGAGPDSYGGAEARLRRDSALAASPGQAAPIPAAGPVATTTASADAAAATAPPTGAPSAAEIDRALGRAPATASAAPGIAAPAPVETAVISPTPGQSAVITPAPGAPGGPRISDENDFRAVSARESIESDAERLARQRSQFQQIPVQALPERPQDTGPNLAQFALETTNAPGEKVYRRGFTSQRKYDRACASQPSAAKAQQAFLAAGGPQTDRLGMDPDGDGFACAWDPRPFRAARG